jgi:hypothetical protein
MADSNRNADFNPTTSTAEYFGLHPDLSLTAAEEAAIMPEVDASMNRRDTISPKVGTQANMLTENNCGKRNFQRWKLSLPQLFSVNVSSLYHPCIPRTSN